MGFHPFEPRGEALDRLVARAATDPLSFPEAGLSADGVDVPDAAIPAGYAVDRYGADLGPDAVFEPARAALARLANYPPDWTEVVLGGPIAVGTGFVTLVAHLGFWSSNPCRILHVTDAPDRWGFGFATVVGHAERGEERFELRREGGRVRYEVFAVSRPAHLLARLGAPFARHLQRRFQRESPAALRAAIDA